MQLVETSVSRPCNQICLLWNQTTGTGRFRCRTVCGCWCFFGSTSTWLHCNRLRLHIWSATTTSWLLLTLGLVPDAFTFWRGRFGATILQSWSIDWLNFFWSENYGKKWIFHPKKVSNWLDRFFININLVNNFNSFRIVGRVADFLETLKSIKQETWKSILLIFFK